MEGRLPAHRAGAGGARLPLSAWPKGRTPSPRPAGHHQPPLTLSYPCPVPDPQIFWLFLIFYGMPAQLSSFYVQSECEWMQRNSSPGFCCVPGSAECSQYYQSGGRGLLGGGG